MDTERAGTLLAAPLARKRLVNGRWRAIVNPRAGGLRHGFVGGTMMCRLAGLIDDIVYTDAPGAALHIAASSGSYDGLVAVGGDGTVCEILGGMDFSRQQLALMPVGTGNCLALELGLRNVGIALDAMVRPSVRTIDIVEATLRFTDGRHQRRYVASTAGMGYAADVAASGKRYFSRLRGQAYSVAAPFVRPRWRALAVSVDGERAQRTRTTGILVNNTRHIGGANAFPAARIDDGTLDAFVFQAGWLRQCLHDIEMVTGLPVYGTPSPRRLSSLKLAFDAPETVMLDGELIGEVVELTLACRPQTLRAIGLPQ